MSTVTNSEFAKRMLLLGRSAEQFRPTATYDPDGDCIEFLFKPDPFRAERVDDLVTVYYSQETDEVIGSLIEGVSKFCQQMFQQLPGFRVQIRDRRVTLDHIFLARLWLANFDPDSLETLTYQKLIEVADELEVEGDLCFA
jgi:hypothetical protein